MRRIVMGHSSSGAAEVLADDTVEPVSAALLPGVLVHRMWELDTVPELPVRTAAQAGGATFFPATGGIRFGFITVPPGLSYEMPPDLGAEAVAAAVAEAEQKLPGMAAAFEPDRPGMHTTRSVDYVVAISGTGTMRSDEGVEIVLRPGDCLIQNGTPHAWFNEADEPFVMAYTLYGTR